MNLGQTHFYRLVGNGFLQSTALLRQRTAGSLHFRFSGSCYFAAGALWRKSHWPGDCHDGNLGVDRACHCCKPTVFFLYLGGSVPWTQGRTVISMCLIAAGLFGIMMIPIPHYVRCPFILQPQGVENIYVDVPGTLSDVYVSLGDQVEKGQPVVKLESPELELQICKLEGKIQSSEMEYQIFQRAAQSIQTDSDLANEVVLA